MSNMRDAQSRLQLSSECLLVLWDWVTTGLQDSPGRLTGITDQNLKHQTAFIYVSSVQKHCNMDGRAMIKQQPVSSQFSNHLPIVSCLINYLVHQEFAGAQTL